MTDAPAVGIIAGGGQFPILCARAAKRQGRRVVAVAHKGETDPALETEVDDLRWIHLGELGKLIKTFKKAGVCETLFVGSITKKRIFKDIRPDLRALALWGRLKSRLDDNILRGLADELEGEGIRVLPSTTFLGELVVPGGVLTRKTPSKAQWTDIRFGWPLAKEIGRLDIGQCLVVKDKVVLAVEAIEGTDETIRRAGPLGGEGAVVIKICKPNQDVRFDLPSVGLGTIETMAQAGASVLVVEAGRALLFDQEATLKRAEQASIVVVGMNEELLN